MRDLLLIVSLRLRSRLLSTTGSDEESSLEVMFDSGVLTSLELDSMETYGVADS